MNNYYADINVQLEKFLSAMPKTDVETVLNFFMRANSIRTGGITEN